MATRIQFRRDTAANWAANNPTPAVGEPCFETDTGVVKIGDGTTPYTSLDGITADAGSQYFDVTMFGATGDGITDDTAAVLAARDAVEASLGGVLYFPSGQYLLTAPITISVSSIIIAGEGTTVPAEATKGTVLLTRHAGIGIDVLSTAAGCRIENLALSGEDASGVHMGGAGLVLRGGERHTVDKVTAWDYLQAGFVCDGTQNSIFNDTGTYFNKYNYWLVNGTRNVRFFNANATDFAAADGAINAAMTAMAPDARALMVGFRANTIGITEDVSSPLAVPSSLTFSECIWERGDRHDHLIELLDAWDRIVFVDCELTYAKTSVMKIDAGCSGDTRDSSFGEPARVYWIRCTPNSTDRDTPGVGEQIINADPDRTRIFLDDRRLFRAEQTIAGLRFNEQVHSQDYRMAKHVLVTPVTFDQTIGTTVVGGTGTATHDATKRRMVIASPGNGTGWIDIAFATPWSHVANWTWDQYHTINVAYSAPTITGDDFAVFITLSAAPWIRQIGVLKSGGGSGILSYQCQGDEGNAIRLISATGAPSTAEFSYFAVSIDSHEPSYSSELVDDTTPQLGGTLDTNGHEIVFPASQGLGDKITLYDGGAGADYKIGIAGGTVYYNTGASGAHRFDDNGVEVARITSAGVSVTAEPTLPSHLTTKAYVDLVAAGSAQRAGIRVVAGSGESAEVKALADYVCDGTADEVQINAAISDLTPSLGSITTQTTKGTIGGLVLLVGGRFNLAGPILLRHFITLSGAYGRTGTWVWATAGYAPGNAGGLIELADINQQYTTVRDLGIQGDGVYVCGIHTVQGLAYEWDAFHIIENTYVFNCGAKGIYLANNSGGRGRGNHVTNVRVVNSGSANNPSRGDAHGVHIDVADSFFSGVDVGSSDGHGFYITRTNNKLTGCKAWFSDNDGFHVTSAARDTHATTLESQDNQGHGYFLDGGSFVGSGLIADSNAYGSETWGPTQGTSDGFYVAANGVNIQGSATDKNEGSRGYFQRYGVNLVDWPKCIVNVTCKNNVSGTLNGSSGVGSVINVVDAV